MVKPETAAILLEPVQGEGGLAVAAADYLKGVRAIAEEFGLLLIFDEVQCGMGRTGRLFAHEWVGVTPDVMALAKGLGGGFPVGACLMTERAAVGMVAGTHGSTFGGNPLAMAAANAVLDVMLADGFLAHVRQVAESLRRRLSGLVKDHPRVFAEVRGTGLLSGLKCVVPNTDMVDRARSLGLLIVSAGENVVRLMPPLIIEEPQIDEAVSILDRVARTWMG
ncbi:MAG TPA: aminotransferase class III-fold pyridoxal phosphate-dependent enzyme, partial [Stellaceae bacterium]|nr:aminotransferase class III-fold pyridoxal phosphate-dependent enzyme [Stellaceae bacterium]